jgi:hypothetical protein
VALLAIHRPSLAAAAAVAALFDALDALPWHDVPVAHAVTDGNSTVRTRSGPRGMATLRNLAVGALHQAARHHRSHPLGQPVHRPALLILGLTS